MSSLNHLDYLLVKGAISHKGENSSSVSDRAVASGSTALTFGEVIGYSTDLITLFDSWLKSPTHKAVIEDPVWNWIGISYKKHKDLYVAVVNFSTGNMDSINIKKTDNRIIISGKYINDFNINTNNFYEIILKNGLFHLSIDIDNLSPIIVFKTEENVISDRLELFFLLDY